MPHTPQSEVTERSECQMSTQPTVATRPMRAMSQSISPPSSTPWARIQRRSRMPANMAASLEARPAANTRALGMSQRWHTFASMSSTNSANATYESLTRNDTTSPACWDTRGMSANDTTATGRVTQAR